MSTVAGLCLELARAVWVCWGSREHQGPRGLAGPGNEGKAQEARKRGERGCERFWSQEPGDCLAQQDPNKLTPADPQQKQGPSVSQSLKSSQTRAFHVDTQQFQASAQEFANTHTGPIRRVSA